MRILVFVETAGARREIVEFVETAGHEAAGVDSLNAALDSLKKQEPDVIVLGADVARPDGVLLAATLRVKHREVQVVGIIPDDDTDRAEKLGMVGVTEVLHGQASSSEVLRAAQRCLERTSQPDFTGFGQVSDNELSALETLFKSSKDNLRGQWLLGFAYYRAGRFHEAFSCLQAVVEGDPSNLQAVYYLGSSHYRLGREDQAVEYWKKVVARGTDAQLSDRAQKHLRRVKRGSSRKPTFTLPPLRS